MENASYFIFVRRQDGVFEATPVEEWHNFKSTVSYRNLNAEEAEEEFARSVVFHGVSLTHSYTLVITKHKNKSDADGTKTLTCSTLW